MDMNEHPSMRRKVTFAILISAVILSVVFGLIGAMAVLARAAEATV